MGVGRDYVFLSFSSSCMVILGQEKSQSKLALWKIGAKERTGNLIMKQLLQQVEELAMDRVVSCKVIGCR